MEHTDNSALLGFLYQIPVAVLQFEADGAIALLNPEAANLLFPLAMGQPLDNVFRLFPGLEPSIQERFQNHSQPGPVFQNELLHYEAPQQRTISLTLSRLDTERGCLVIHDVTESERLRRQLEEEEQKRAAAQGRAENAAAVLHDIGNAVTAAATQSALLFQEDNWPELKSGKRLLRLFESKETELNEALGAGKGQAVVQLMTQILEHLDERQRGILDTAAKLNRSHSHIEDILLIQRQQQGQQSLSHDCNLLQLMENALSLQESSLRKRKIEHSLHAAEVKYPVRADGTALTQLLINLLRNSMEALARCEPAIDAPRIESSLLVEAGRVHLRVQDNGSGFDPGMAEKLFERGRSSKRNPSGIGLAHCRKIAEAHQGTLHLESAGPGQGACAILNLPLSST